MNLENLRRTFRKKYTAVAVEDIDLILAHVCQISRLELFLNYDRIISREEQEILDAFINRRLSGEPLQYIFGEAPFREFNLRVGEGVLIPRPETEMLVDLALDGLPEKAAVCDVGTGSGAIAVAIAAAMPDSSVTALELSEKAIKYARENIEKYQLKNISLRRSDLLAAVALCKFDLITANLPYVAADLYEKLACEVRSFEPGEALLSGRDGLGHIRCLAVSAKSSLHPNGRIILEFSPEQEQTVCDILNDEGYLEVTIIKDLNRRARFAIGKTKRCHTF